MNETKRRILDKSKKLFKEKGFKDTTINEICKEAKISKHTFYYYFDSKEILFENLVFPNEEELKTTILSEIALKNSAFEKYMTINNSIINKYVEFGPQLATELFIYKLSSSLLKREHGPMHQILNSLIEQAKKDGEINCEGSSSDLLRYTGAMMVGITFFWAKSNGRFDLKTEINDSVCTLLNVNRDLINFENLG